MNITFRTKYIYDAPIDILRHLYYYTVQYGLSVAQFTGKNPEYWRRLPDLLEKDISNRKSLMKIIGELKAISAEHNKRVTRRREQFETGWISKEVVLNAQLDSVLLSFPGSILAEAFQKIAPIFSKNKPNDYQVVRVEIKGSGGQDMSFVEPDLLLKDKRQLLMIELKTKGWAQSARKYPPGQLLNYFRLVMECRKLGIEKNSSFAHLILVPTDDLTWLESASKWVKQYDPKTGLLQVDYTACFKLAGKPEKIERELAEFVKHEGKTIPIYLRSWSFMRTTFEQVVRNRSGSEFYTHWNDIVQELAELEKRAIKFVE